MTNFDGQVAEELRMNPSRSAAQESTIMSHVDTPAAKEAASFDNHDSTPSKVHQIDIRREDSRRFTFQLDPELAEALESHCAMRLLALNETITRSEVVRRALESYLDGYADELRKLVLQTVGDLSEDALKVVAD